jgi:hypothetical protein
MNLFIKLLPTLILAFIILETLNLIYYNLMSKVINKDVLKDDTLDPTQKLKIAIISLVLSLGNLLYLIISFIGLFSPFKIYFTAMFVLSLLFNYYYKVYKKDIYVKAVDIILSIIILSLLLIKLMNWY